MTRPRHLLAIPAILFALSAAACGRPSLQFFTDLDGDGIPDEATLRPRSTAHAASSPGRAHDKDFEITAALGGPSHRDDHERRMGIVHGRPEEIVAGDLNGDRRADLAYISVVEHSEGDSVHTDRAVGVQFGTEDGFDREERFAYIACRKTLSDLRIDGSAILVREQGTPVTLRFHQGRFEADPPR